MVKNYAELIKLFMELNPDPMYEMAVKASQIHSSEDARCWCFTAWRLLSGNKDGLKWSLVESGNTYEAERLQAFFDFFLQPLGYGMPLDDFDDDDWDFINPFYFVLLNFGMSLIRELREKDIQRRGSCFMMALLINQHDYRKAEILGVDDEEIKL